jgi:hypothetical protein
MYFDDVVAAARAKLIDGVIEGTPFGETVGRIVDIAIEFGTEEAEKADSFFASVRCDNVSELKALAVGQAIDELFDSKGIAGVARNVTTLGAAFGFQEAKRRIKYADIEAEVKRVKDEATENDGKVSGETMEAFLQQVFVLIDGKDLEAGIYYLRDILTSSEQRVSFNSTEVPSFSKLTKLYSTLILG